MNKALNKKGKLSFKKAYGNRRRRNAVYISVSMGKPKTFDNSGYIGLFNDFMAGKTPN